MRVLAVAQRLDQPPAEGAKIRRIGLELTREPVRDGCVIGGGAGVGFGGQTPSQGERGGTLMGRELVEHGLIILRLDDHGDIVVVLGRSADHRGPADIDILDAGLETGALIDRRLERVEIDNEQIDRRDAVALHRLGMFGIVADRQQSAMDLRMQGFYPTVHHLGKSGQLGYVPDLQSCRRERLRGAAGRDQLNTVGGQGAGEFDQSGFIGNGQQGAGYAARMVGHGQDPLLRVLLPRRAADIPALPDGAPSKVASRASDG